MLSQLIQSEDYIIAKRESWCNGRKSSKADMKFKCISLLGCLVIVVISHTVTVISFAKFLC